MNEVEIVVYDMIGNGGMSINVNYVAKVLEINELEG